MKVLHVIDSLAVGGAEILLRDTVKLLADMEHVICYLRKPDELKAHFVNINVHFLAYKSRRSLPQTIYRLRKIIKDEQVDIVHTHLFLSTIIGRAACWKSKAKFVSTVHSLLGVELFIGSRISLWIERLTVSKRHNMIAVSGVVMADYKTHIPFKGKEFVLHNFVSNNFFKSNTVASKAGFKTLKIVSVGNLRPVKNHIFLLRAIREIKNLPIEIDIYGEGNDRVMLQEEIDRYQLPVQLKGLVLSIEDILPSYHCFITCSLFEGYGIAPMEAMAVGLPVLAPDIPIFNEVMGKHALYFDISSHLSLNKLITEIVHGKIDLVSWSARSKKQAVETATVDQYHSGLTRIYRSIMSK